MPAATRDDVDGINLDILRMAGAPSSLSSPKALSSKSSLYIVSWQVTISSWSCRFDDDLVKNSDTPIETLVKVSG